MGASGWSYYVPYDANIGSALKKLRQEVFQRGDYLLLEDWGLLDEADKRIAAGEDSALVEADRLAKRAQIAKPASIAELFEWNQEAGTHSIIDMERGVSTDPDFGTLSPLTDQQLHAAFGTTTPMLAQIEQWEASGDAIGSLRSRWEGLLHRHLRGRHSL